MKKHNTSDRLREIMSERNLRQVDILNMTLPYCKKYEVKMNKSDISQYVSGKVEPNQDKLAVLGMALNLNEAWLMGYDVPMERNNNNYIKEESPKILQYYETLNDIGKHEATKRVEELTYIPQYIKKNEEDYLKVNAAHARTDIIPTDEDQAHDDAIMNDDSEWE